MSQNRHRDHRRDRRTAGPVVGSRSGRLTDPSTASPEQLLARAAKGDQVAFARLYDTLAPAVYGLALRVARDRGDAENLTREVFAQLWQTAAQLDLQHGTVATRAMILTHRRAVDRVRAEPSRHDREYTAGAVADHTGNVSGGCNVCDDPVDEHLELIVDRGLIRCLADVSESECRAILRAYYDGYTYTEVADRLGATHPAVTTWMRDGLRKLRISLTAPSSSATTSI